VTTVAAIVIQVAAWLVDMVLILAVVVALGHAIRAAVSAGWLIKRTG
jgi:hypothetical protein